MGTSGWAYPERRSSFYAGVPRSRWLERYAHHIAGGEVNGTFYDSLPPRLLARWREATPAGIRFSIEAGRYLTRFRRLAVDAASLSPLLAKVDALGAKAALVLWQLPRGWRRDVGRLAEFAGILDGWRQVWPAVEFRDPSWFVAQVADLPAAHHLALVQSDAADWPAWEAVKTDLAYVRLHGGKPTYQTAALGRWVARIRRWSAGGRTVHIYFDNIAAGHAVANGRRLAAAFDASQKDAGHWRRFAASSKRTS